MENKMSNLAFAGSMLVTGLILLAGEQYTAGACCFIACAIWGK